jgi:hypothetical protein
MQPYWTAIKAGNYQKAHGLRTSEWQTKHSVEDLAGAYDKAEKEHGTLEKTWIHVANEYREPGQVGDACRVEALYEFSDGWRGKITFNLTRPDEKSAWEIGNSAAPLSLSLGDGPY